MKRKRRKISGKTISVRRNQDGTVSTSSRGASASDLRRVVPAPLQVARPRTPAALSLAIAMHAPSRPSDDEGEGDEG